MTRFLSCAVIVLFALPSVLLAQGSLEDLTKPIEGRSMRATSSFRGTLGSKTVIKNRKSPARLRPEGRFLSGPARRAAIRTTSRSSRARRTSCWKPTARASSRICGSRSSGPEPQDWAPNGAANHQEMLLRIYYDGNPRPAVEAPVGDFFANCFGKRSEVNSLPVVVEDGDSYNCFWQMPFRKSIRIEIVNESEKQIRLLYYNIDWIKKDKISEDTPYFYAQYRQEYPVEQGKDYVILDTKGKGHYVGTVLAVRTRSPAWFGEGDERIYIDGEKKPSIQGTGTEDYFLSAWGLKTVQRPVFRRAVFRPMGHRRRPHQRLPLAHQRSDRLQHGHQGHHRALRLDVGGRESQGRTNSWNERQDDYSSVAFWYQTGTPTFTARAPHARERTLPSLERVTRCRTTISSTTSITEPARRGSRSCTSSI